MAVEKAARKARQGATLLHQLFFWLDIVLPDNVEPVGGCRTPVTGGIPVEAILQT